MFIIHFLFQFFKFFKFRISIIFFRYKIINICIRFRSNIFILNYFFLSSSFSFFFIFIIFYFFFIFYCIYICFILLIIIISTQVKTGLPDTPVMIVRPSQVTCSGERQIHLIGVQEHISDVQWGWKCRLENKFHKARSRKYESDWHFHFWEVSTTQENLALSSSLNSKTSCW